MLFAAGDHEGRPDDRCHAIGGDAQHQPTMSRNDHTMIVGAPTRGTHGVRQCMPMDNIALPCAAMTITLVSEPVPRVTGQVA